MKKIATIVTILLIILITFGGNQVYAETNIINEQSESQLIKIKDNTAKS